MSSASPTAILNTTRCTLRPAAHDDESALCIAAAPSGDTSRIGQLLAHSSQWWAAHPYGLWTILDARSRALIGWCGLRPQDSPLNPELFFGLTPSAQGKGLASEAARAVTHYALALPVSNRCGQRRGWTMPCR
jgi:RimJ/RimL family protein N-acetyltransferase